MEVLECLALLQSVIGLDLIGCLHVHLHWAWLKYSNIYDGLVTGLARWRAELASPGLSSRRANLVLSLPHYTTTHRSRNIGSLTLKVKVKLIWPNQMDSSRIYQSLQCLQAPYKKVLDFLLVAVIELNY